MQAIDFITGLPLRKNLPRTSPSLENWHPATLSATYPQSYPQSYPQDMWIP